MDLVKVLQNGEKKEDTKLAPLLLGDGKAEEEVRILKQIGFKEDIEKQEDIIGEKVVLDSIKKEYSSENVYTINNIVKICDTYHMLFQPVKNNTNKNIDIKAVVAEIINFNKTHNKSLENVQQDFFVLSTSELFPGKKRPFMLFYKPTEEQTYILIYSSDNVIQERRKILGKVFDSSNSLTIVLTVILSIITFSIVAKYSNNLAVQMLNHWIASIVIIILIVGTLMMVSMGLLSAIFFKDFSEGKLNSFGQDYVLHENNGIIKYIFQTCTTRINGKKYDGYEHYKYYYDQYLNEK